jgi:hypothetical protein
MSRQLWNTATSIATMPPTRIKLDNASVLSMLEGITLKSSNKHIFNTLAENRERVYLDKHVVAVKIDTALNISNALTKQGFGVADSAVQFDIDSAYYNAAPAKFRNGSIFVSVRGSCWVRLLSPPS